MIRDQLLVIFLLSILAACVTAKPYYYLFQDDAIQKAQQAADKVKSDVEAATSDPAELPQRIHGHLEQLYNHGSTAVKNVVDTMQPDLSNIRKDLGDVYQVTRDNVGRRIEPLAHTVRPYIDHAQKVVAPYVNQAKEEVPKLINQAGPAISKVGEQVRDGLTGVWDKITSVGQPESAAQQVASQAQKAGEQVQQAATNAIQQAPEAARQASEAATQQASAATS